MDEEEVIDWSKVNWTDSDAMWNPNTGLYKKAFGEDEEMSEKDELDDEYKIFLCSKCGYILDETKEPHKPLLKELLKKDGKCPNCGKPIRENYKEISKKEMEKLKKEQEIAKKKEQKRIKNAEENIKDDCVELLLDLRDRLIDGKITAQRFVALYLNLAYEILKYYTNKLPDSNKLSISMLEYRKHFLSLCDYVLEHYTQINKSKEILEEYDEEILQKMTAAEKLSDEFKDNIKEDKLFIAESKYYFEDDKFAIPAYELDERVKEYENLQDEIEKKEKQKEQEEKYQAQVLRYSEKIEARKIRREERILS